MPSSNIKLPKVTQYVRNVGKSVAFASINAVKDNMQGIKGFAEDNEDVFVEIYSGVKNYRDTLKKAERSIKDSNIYKAIEYGAKNMIEDARTGNFYNDRTSEISESALGVDDDSLGLDFNYEVSSGSSQSSSNKFIADTFNDAMKSSTIGTTTAVARGTDMVVRSTKASTTILSSQIEKSTATIHSGIGAVYNSVNQINQFLNGPMMAHLENSRTYYDHSLKIMQEQHAMMKEMLEMQRNLYGAQAKQYSNSRLDQSMNSNGMVNMRGYGKIIKNNFMDLFGIGGFGDAGINAPMLFAAAPFKILMDEMFKALMPSNMKKNLKLFDNIATGIFGQFIGKMNKNKNSSNTFLNMLGQIFGINIEDKKSINTSKYNKGAVAFDGITRKTIVEVIPGYLARIEAALTGRGERHYDPHSGKWRTARQIEKDFDKERISTIESANRSITYDIAGDPRFQSKGYQKAIRKFKEQIYEDGYFDAGLRYNPRSKADANGRRSRSSADDAYKKYGFKSKKAFDAFLSMLSDETISGLATSNLRAKQARSRKMQEYEDMGSVFNVLFNDAYNDGSTKSGSYSSPSKYVTGGLLNSSTDKYGKNVFYYLREILKGINSRWKPSTNTSSTSRKSTTKVKVRRSHSREYSTSSESEDDSGSDDDDEWDSVDADLSEQERRDAQERANKNAAKDWVNDNLNKSPIGKFFKNAINGVSKIISSPLKFINDLLEQANNNMFSLMFGDMKLEVDGKRVDNVFQFIVDQVKTKFDEIGKYVKDIFNPLWDRFKNWIKPYAEPLWNELKGIGGAAKERVKSGLSNTFGRAGNYIMSNLPKSIANKVSNGGVATADEIEAASHTNDGIGANARGRVVTKRGLTMISPGEIIIPASFDRKKQNKMLALEKRDRRRIINAIGLNATGNVQTEELKKRLAQIYEENKGNNKTAKIGAGGIAGLGAGLLTGFNPFLAALAGAGISVLDNSDTLKNIVFGEVADEETGDRKGGLISKKIQDTFKKYAPDMGDFGIAGGVLGLLTPFGPFMGAAIGAGIGFLKNSEGFKKFVFGNEGEDDGLISEKAYEAFKDKVKKAAPKMLLGAGAGILAGPFGLLGNAAIGAGFGLISTTETFQNFLYGEADDNGERHGGVVDAFKTGFLEPAKEKFLEFVADLKEYSQKHIFEPMKNFWKPVNQMLKNVIQTTGDRITDHINDMFERTVGLPLHDFLQEKIFKPVGKVVFGVLKAPYNIGKALVSAPFKALGGIGNSIRASQIRRGTAYNMTANERLAWRKEHGVRFGKLNAWRDKTLEQDEFYAGIGTDKEGMDRLENIADLSKTSLSSYTSLQKDAGTARKNVGNEVSKFFNTKTDEGRNRFNKVGYKDVNKLTKIAQTKSLDDANSFIDKMKNLTDEEKKNLKDKIAEKVRIAERANKNLETFKTGSDKIDEELSKLLGRKVKGRKDRRKIMRSAEAELKARKKINERANESDETKAIRDSSELALKKADTIINVLNSIDKTMKDQVFGGVKSTKPKGTENNSNNTSTNTSNSENKSESTPMAEAMALSRAKEQKKKKSGLFGKAIGKVKGWLGLGSNGADMVDEDSKAAHDAAKVAAKKEQNEITNTESNIKQVSILTKIKEALVGEKDGKDTGFLGKLWRGLGTVGKWLGIGGLVLTGTSLFGHLTQWFKINVWPNLKSLMFGKDGDNTDGVVGKFTNGIRTYIFGDGTEANRGLFGNTKDALTSWWEEKASPWLDGKINAISTWFESEGGFTGIFTNRILPGFINGLGYAINNLLGPTIGALLKAAPSLLTGLGKALLDGIKVAFINRGVGGSRTTLTDGGASAEYIATINSINSTIEGADRTGTVGKIKPAFANLGSSIKGSGSYDIDSSTIFTNSGDASKNNKPSGGIMGALGQTSRTNTVEFDDNGNVITNYSRFNKTDSLGSYIANASGRNFIKGLGGNTVSSKVIKGAGDDVVKATGKFLKSGAISKIKGAFGFTKAATKTGLNVVGKAGSTGSKLNAAIGKAADSMNYKGKFLDTTKGIVNAAGDSDAKKGILGGITKIFKNIVDNNSIIGKIVNAAKTLTGKEITEKIVKEAIEKIGAKLGKSLIAKASTAALKGLGNIISKFSPLTLATFVIDFIWGFDNADTVLGVAKGTYDINLGHRCICGLVNMLTNFFTLGLLPADVIMDICIEYLFPIFGLDTTSIQAARDQAQAAMDEWNKANPNETYDNLQDFNNKDKWWFKAKKGISNAWTDTKEAVSKSFSSVSEKIKEVGSNTLDIGKFVKDVTTNLFKSVINPDHKWDIDDYIEEDDPLAGAKKTIYHVLKFPLSIVSTVSNAGKVVYEKVKEFASDVKDGISDAWGDISAVAKGQYSVFSTQYWKFNNTDDENPLGIVSKIAASAVKYMAVPYAMVGYAGSKIWQGLKALISGAKEGVLDASSDILAVTKGQYTIFSKDYWKSDNTDENNSLSLLGSIFGFISRLTQAPHAMLGYVGSKVWQGIKAVISGAKEGILDASSDVLAVTTGQYTIFSKDYWKSDNTDENNSLSIIGSIFGFVSRLTQAPYAMLGYVGSKVWQGIKAVISGAKEGVLDASSDILAVTKGEYTIFSKDYWKSDNTDENNSLSVLGGIFGFVSRLTQAPHAMLGYVGSKVWQGFKALISGAKEGALDASSDVDAVKAGEYTIFSKDYWKSDNTDEDNSLSIMGSVFGTISRLLQAPGAMLVYVGGKIKSVFDSMINGVEDISNGTDSIVKKAENGEISVFSNEYWKITVDENNPLGMLGKVVGLMQRLVNAPIILIKNLIASIGDKLEDAKEWLSGIFGGGNRALNYNATGLSNSVHGLTTAKQVSGSGHIYQSNRTLSNIPYGDSTIGDSGCAPVAAANLLNNSGKGNALVRDAARYAERHGMTVPGGGTSIDFFNSYLGSKGISTRNSSNRASVMNALANGNQVIMLGRDDYNMGAPFGTNPHFITAKGISSNGNIIVEDPDLPYSSIEYHPNDVMGSMITSVITGSGRKHRTSHIYSGRSARINNAVALYDNGGSTSYNSSSKLYASAIVNVAKSQLGVSEVDGTSNKVKYNHAYYGSNVSGSAYPWCAAFVWWVFNQAGANSLINKSALCDSHLSHFKNKGRYDKNPKVGDVIFFRFDGCAANRNSNHEGIVIAVTSTHVTTIEGNTSGGTVKSNTYSRSNSSIIGYGHPDYPYTYSSSGVIDMSKYGDNTNYKAIATGAIFVDDVINSTITPDNYNNTENNTTYVSYNADTTNNSTSNTSTNLMTAIGNLGKNIVKKLYGEDVYNSLYGDNTSTSDSTTNSSTSSSSSSSNSSYSNINTSNPGSTMPQTYTTKQIWNALIEKGFSKAGTAGIMGNMNMESRYITNNLQDGHNYKFGMTDEEYTNAVNNKSYSKDRFMRDEAGYGLIQATYGPLKGHLYKHTIENGRRIDDLQGQIDSLTNWMLEYPEYSSLNKYLRQTTNVAEASDRFLREFEKPEDPQSTIQKRRDYAWQAYNTYGSGRAPGYFGNGRATRALNSVRSGRGGNTVIATQGGIAGVDYVTFLKTIIEILISISNNTALLNRILEILSLKFNIDINASQVTNATSNNTRAQAQKALNKLINSNTDSSSMAKLINSKDTQYLLSAMAAIAGE